MSKTEFIKSINEASIDDSKVKKIEDLYSDSLPEVVKKIISCNDSSLFLDDEIRILSLTEIINAEKDLHVDFPGVGIVPIADCGDNDFIVYDYKNSAWAKFNIVDKTIFKKRATLEELL